MQRRLLNLIVIIGLPAVLARFVFDWFGSGLLPAIAHLPTRAFLILVVLSLWAVFREYRERKKHTFR